MSFLKSPLLGLGSVVAALLAVSPVLAEDTNDAPASTRMSPTVEVRFLSLAFGANEIAGTVQGTIIDASTLRPLSGAQVVVEGTGRGTLTDPAGRFMLPDVPAGPHTLRVTYIGFRSETRSITVVEGQAIDVDVSLEISAVAMDEIVVTGTGVVTERRRLGQTISTVGAQELEEVVASDLTQVLQGRIAGLVTQASTGELGSGSQVRLRGTVSMSQRNEPLYYVDGVRIDNTGTSNASISVNPLNDINPADIERIEVIKGAAAATLFGTEASAGVIQIFTKRGSSSGPPRYSLEIEQGFSKVPATRIPTNFGYDAQTGQVLSNFPAGDYISTGRSINLAGSIQGGIETTQYVISGRFRDEEGSLPNNSLGNWSTRVGLDHAFTDRLRAQFDLNVINSTIDAPYPTWGFLGEAVLANPTSVSDLRPYGELFYTIDGALAYSSTVAGTNRTMSGKLNYDWAEGVGSEVVVGYNTVTRERVLNVDRGASPFNDPTGLRNLFDRQQSALTLDFKTSWQTDFGENLNSTFVVGGQSFWENGRTKSVGVRDFAAPGLETLDGGATVYNIGESQSEVVNAGLFVQEQLGLWNRLFVTVGARMDGNSAFGEDLGLQAYPKAGASWVVSDHSFWDMSRFGWDQFRLRGAIGTSGLQPGAFDAQRTWSPSAMLNNQPVVRPQNLGNSQLKPERSREIEFAAEFGFFDGTLGFEAVYFDQKTTDALLQMPSAPSLGFLNPQLTNVGELTSKGLELTADWSVLRTPTVAWSLNGSLATLDQVVTDIGDRSTFRVSGTQRRYNSMAVGYQPGAVMAPTVDPDNPSTLAVPIEELTSLGQITPNFLRTSTGADSIVFIGNQAPTLTGTIGSRLGLGDAITVQALISGASGFVMMNETEITRAASGISEEVAGMQRALADPNTTTAERQAIVDQYSSKDPRVISQWAESGDYIRFQELSLTYQVPSSFAARLGANRLSVAVAGRNLALFTRYSGMQDPGSSASTQAFVSNIDYFRSPSPRTLTLQIRAGW